MRHIRDMVMGLFLSLCFGPAFAQQLIAQSFQREDAFEYHANDSAQADIVLLKDTSGNPMYYTSHLVTDVCSDGLCKPIDINIYWDLLGNFQEYKTSEEHVLTKFDHIEMTKEDHKRLHEILSDTSSILRDYKVEDMIDTTIKVQSGILDAVTGATSPTFEGVSVEGAMYTVYTLWHFINGDVRHKIYEHTESLLSDSLIRHMLRSDNRDYVNFIFSRLSDTQRSQFTTAILPLISSKDLYIPHFAIAGLSDEALADGAVQESVLNQFATVPPAVQNSILARIENLHLQAKSIQLLLDAVPTLAVSQFDKVFHLIENNKQSVDANALKSLDVLAMQQDKPFASGAKRVMGKVGN